METKRRWFQFHLSSLLCAQLVLATIVFLNFFLEGYTSDLWHYFGWPFKSFRDYSHFQSLEICWDAMYANLLVWPTMVLAALFLPKIYLDLKRQDCLSPVKIWQRLNLSWATLGCMFLAMTTLIVLSLIPTVYEINNYNYKWCTFGWPKGLVEIEYRKLWGNRLEREYVEWWGYRYLVIDLYVWAACIGSTGAICELIVRRFRRGKI